MAIFKQYDIRGKYPSEINEEAAKKIAQAFGTLYKGKILVASDVRKSSPSLKKSVIEGLLSTGARIVDAGELPSPTAVFATAYFKLDGCMIITASHNPPEYNGIKLYDRGGPISYESGIGKIEELVKSGRFSKGNGSIEKLDPESAYIEFLTSKIKAEKKLKIVIDCFNGADSRIAPATLRRLGAEVVEVRCGFNGEFPKDGPDPSKKHNLDPLKQAVIEEKADLGFAFDGDGDRLAVIDERGEFIDPKFVFSMLIKNAAIDSPQIKVVYDSLTSQTVLDSINSIGGTPLACRVGHTYINQKILEENASLAGEISGHYFFKEVFGCDDALFAGMKIIEYISRRGKRLSEICREFTNYYFDSLRLDIKESEKFSFIEKLKNDLSLKYKIETLDGVRVRLDGGWALFRLSNTEPKISIAFEALDGKKFEEIRGFVNSVVERIPR